MSTVAVRFLTETGLNGGGWAALGAGLMLTAVLVVVFWRFLRDIGESLVGLVVALFAPLPPLGRVFVCSLLAGLTVGALLVGFDIVDPDPGALGGGPVADQAMQVASEGTATPGQVRFMWQLLALGVVFVAGFAVGGEVEKRTLNAQWRRLASRRRDHNEAVRRGRPDPGVVDVEETPVRPVEPRPAELEAGRE